MEDTTTSGVDYVQSDLNVSGEFHTKKKSNAVFSEKPKRAEPVYMTQVPVVNESLAMLSITDKMVPRDRVAIADERFGFS